MTGGKGSKGFSLARAWCRTARHVREKGLRIRGRGKRIDVGRRILIGIFGYVAWSVGTTSGYPYICYPRVSVESPGIILWQRAESERIFGEGDLPAAKFSRP